MGHPVRKVSLCSTRQQSPKPICSKWHSLRSVEGDCSISNSLHQQRHQMVHQDSESLKKKHSQRAKGFILPAPRSTRIEIGPACRQSIRQSTPLLPEDQTSVVEDNHHLVSKHLGFLSSPDGHSDQPRMGLFDACTPPTVLSGLFSDDPTWVECPGKGYTCAPNKECVWGPVDVATGFCGPRPVAPVGEFASPLDSHDGTTLQTLFVSLTREPNDRMTSHAPQSATSSRSQKNIVDIIMAQLTDSNYDSNSNDDIIAPHTCEAPSALLSSLFKNPTYPEEELIMPCFAPLCEIKPLTDIRMSGHSDLPDEHREDEPIHEYLARCEAPLAVGCSPPSSARRKEYGGNVVLHDKELKNSVAAGIPHGHGNNTMKSTNGGRSSGSRTNQLNRLSPSIPLMPVVDITTLSSLHRNTYGALHVRSMIKEKESHPGELLMIVERPPRTSDDVVSLLKQYRAKELLRHLRVVSFARRNAECVRELFESWGRKGIPPSDVLFGAYYLYVMKQANREMCLKHNGRGRAMGYGRGCDYALKGPSFRCRYRHACLFCNARDHGWFDEKHCGRYLNLQKEMIRLGVTDSVARVLLDALECDDNSNIIGNI